MPEVTAFAALRFDPKRVGGDLSAVLAPPYDVLDQGDKRRLLARNEHNIVAVDLPHIPPKSAGPPEVYEEAAKRLDAWLRDGIMSREPKPAIYAYHQRFEQADRRFTRRMFIARMRLVPFSEGSILPHEQTFGGPKEDRLALMKAAKCQLSPIFGLYTDPENRVGTAFAAATVGDPHVTGMLEGVENRMWVVTDEGLIAAVAATMKEKKVYIADGHHRYGTSLMYRDWLANRQGGVLAHNHPANFVMFVLASMDDPGCLILPYHRALAGVTMGTVLAAWSGATQEVPPGKADLVLYDGQTGKETALRFLNHDVLATLEPDQCEAWRRLDYAYLHRYLIDELLTGKLQGKAPKVHYVKSAEDARRTAKDESGVALLTNATSMAQIRAVSEAGGLMPQKSTFFYPKLATGMTVNPLS